MGLSGNHTGPGRGNPRRAGKDVSEQMMFQPTFEGCKEMVSPVLVVVSWMNAFKWGCPVVSQVNMSGVQAVRRIGDTDLLFHLGSSLFVCDVKF